jgi:hypothetical protein
MEFWDGLICIALDSVNIRFFKPIIPIFQYSTIPQVIGVFDFSSKSGNISP